MAHYLGLRPSFVPTAAIGDPKDGHFNFGASVSPDGLARADKTKTDEPGSQLLLRVYPRVRSGHLDGHIRKEFVEWPAICRTAVLC